MRTILRDKRKSQASSGVIGNVFRTPTCQPES
jgi:hypothetical protein